MKLNIFAFLAFPLAFCAGNGDPVCTQENKPVCAEGITFQNVCLAIEQGEGSFKEGPCEGDLFQFSEEESNGSFLSTDLYRFMDEGFQFVGRVDISSNDNPQNTFTMEGDPDPKDIEANPPSLPTSPHENHMFRATIDGMLYVAREFVPLDDEVSVSTSPEDGPPKTQEQENRKLYDDCCGGTDSRTTVSSSFVWPYWRIGQLYNSSFGGGFCTGTIIGRNKVVTAAHCVFDTSFMGFRTPRYFAPGRFRNDGEKIDPWGSWPVLYATIYGGWTTTSSVYDWTHARYDVAVLTMGTNWAGDIGTHMGALQLTAHPDRCDDESFVKNFYDAETRVHGYPGAPYVSGELVTTGQCNAPDSWFIDLCMERYHNMMYHYCDSSPGMSGAAFLDRNQHIYAILSGGSSSTGIAHMFESWFEANSLRYW